jgi:hypothetical protein
LANDAERFRQALPSALDLWVAEAAGVAGVAVFALLGFVFTADPALVWLAPWGFMLGLVPLAYRLDARPPEDDRRERG